MNLKCIKCDWSISSSFAVILEDWKYCPKCASPLEVQMDTLRGEVDEEG